MFVGWGWGFVRGFGGGCGVWLLVCGLGSFSMIILLATILCFGWSFCAKFVRNEFVNIVFIC